MSKCWTVVRQEAGSHHRSDIMQKSAKVIESRSIRAAETNKIAEYRSGDRALSMLVADDDASVVELLANYGHAHGLRRRYRVRRDSGVSQDQTDEAEHSGDRR